LTKLFLSTQQLEELEISVPLVTTPPTSTAINASFPYEPQQLIWLWTDDQWEDFVKEWAHCQKTIYKLVARMGGANDYGVDVACFKTGKGFLGDWDNFQCKHYKDSLRPSDAIPEIGKLLWHVFNGHITAPSAYYFFAPKDCGPSLKKLLLDTSKLKNSVFENWQNQCQKTITSKHEVPLEGKFLIFVNTFDFSVFKYKPTHEVLEDHKKTPYHAARFGGGLGERPQSCNPPSEFLEGESRYVEQLLEAYNDCDVELENSEIVQEHPMFKSHFGRSRESFFEAEALHAFARDSVPNGTFEKLQDEVCFGVKDTEEDHHVNAFRRVKEVTKTASSLNVQSNGLYGVVGVKDLQGICHQLANVDRLTWKKP